MDHRVFVSTIVDRVGPIGGSPVAESYRSAGLLGVVIVMIAIGVLVGWLDARPPGSGPAYLVGPLSYVLFIWIRNDFTPVFVQTCFSLCIVVIALKVNQLILRPDRQGPLARPPAARERKGTCRAEPAQDRVFGGP